MDREIERAIDKEVDAQIERDRELRALAETLNFDEETENAEVPCCDDCAGQSAYFLRKG